MNLICSPRYIIYIHTIHRVHTGTRNINIILLRDKIKLEIYITSEKHLQLVSVNGDYNTLVKCYYVVSQTIDCFLFNLRLRFF